MRMSLLFCRVSAPLLLAGLLLSPAAGADALLKNREPVQVALLAAGPDRVGLQVRLAPGWKFYWRSPGEGGVPTRFDWSQSHNLAAAEIAWPAPQRITIGKADLHGYRGEVVLPIALTPRQGGAPVALDVRIEFGICKDICILREERLTRLLPPDAVPDPGAALVLAKWQAQVPRPAAQAGIKLVERHAEPGRLTVVLRSALPFERPDLFVEGAPEAWFGRPQATLSPDRREVRFILPVQPANAVGRGKPLTLTVTDGARAAELILDP